MVYSETPPEPALADVVRYFWTIEHASEDACPIPYRLFAESSPGLVFFYYHHYSLLSGLTDHHRDFTIRGRFGMIGAYLYPYVLPALFKLSAEEITNTQVELTTLLGADGRQLKDQVMSAEDNTQRMRIISNYLLSKKNSVNLRDTHFHSGVRHIIQYKGVITLDSLVKDMGISNRQFDRRFLSSVGTGPKFYTRLVRFQAALQKHRFGQIKNLTDLALAAGYFDQSHFIRDFKQFSGMSPRQYFSLHEQHSADNFIRLNGLTE